MTDSGADSVTTGRKLENYSSLDNDSFEDSVSKINNKPSTPKPIEWDFV